MTDKELGKLWADTNYLETGYSGLVASLIRKLVEEQKILLLTRHAKGGMWTDEEEAAAEKVALRDFAGAKEGYLTLKHPFCIVCLQHQERPERVAATGQETPRCLER